MLGGLARRAGLMRALRAHPEIPVLTVIGAGEFAMDAAWPDPTKTGPGTATLVRKAYDLLHVDAGGVFAPTARWFRKEGGKLPSGFAEVGAEPVVRRFERGGFRAAVIFFPTLGIDQAGQITASPQLASVLAAGRQVRDADLLIGVSPWGLEAEQAALPQLGQVYHVVLGGGPGAPFPCAVPDNAPGLLWSRADRRGRSIIVLDLLELPGRNPAHAWIQELNVHAREAVLDQTVPEDPEMAAVLRRP